MSQVDVENLPRKPGSVPPPASHPPPRRPPPGSPNQSRRPPGHPHPSRPPLSRPTPSRPPSKSSPPSRPPPRRPPQRCPTPSHPPPIIPLPRRTPPSSPLPCRRPPSRRAPLAYAPVWAAADHGGRDDGGVATGGRRGRAWAARQRRWPRPPECPAGRGAPGAAPPRPCSALCGRRQGATTWEGEDQDERSAGSAGSFSRVRDDTAAWTLWATGALLPRAPHRGFTPPATPTPSWRCTSLRTASPPSVQFREKPVRA